MNRKEELRAYISKMIKEAHANRSQSVHVLCKENECERYLVEAFYFSDTAVTLEMTLEGAHKLFSKYDCIVYHDDRQSIDNLISDWIKVEDYFRS